MNKLGFKGRAGGPLSIVATILVASAFARVFGLSAEAFASSDAAQVPSSQEAMLNQDAELDQLLQRFAEREQSIKAEEERIAERSAALKQAETELSSKIAELKAAEKQLREVLEIADTAAEDDVARLTAVYESMKPKDAAKVFDEMNPDFAAGFMSRMKPDAAAAIMAGLPSQSAYAISVVLAGRHSEKYAK